MPHLMLKGEAIVLTSIIACAVAIPKKKIKVFATKTFNILRNIRDTLYIIHANNTDI